jgi:FkbM family methyltransferase
MANFSAQKYINFAKQIEVETFIEIGAHRGEKSIDFLKSNGGRIAIAIEANPFTYNRLLNRARKRGVRTLNFAVSEVRSKVKLYIPMWSENLMPGNASLRKRAVENVDYTEIQVPTITLDHVVEEYNCRGRTALWIDVEGAAIEVLRSANNILNRGQVELIYIEVETDQFWSRSHDVNIVIDFLRQKNFEKLWRDNEYENQYNIAFIRKDLLGNPKIKTAIPKIADFKKINVNFLDQIQFWLILIISKLKHTLKNFILIFLTKNIRNKFLARGIFKR